MIDTLKQLTWKRDGIDALVMITPPEQVNKIEKKAESDRWIYAATLRGFDWIMIHSGDLDEPLYTDDRVERISDAINHEFMHIMIENLEGEEASVRYDDLLRNVVEETGYLHKYAHMGVE